jgi:hypothetical protein
MGFGRGERTVLWSSCPSPPLTCFVRAGTELFQLNGPNAKNRRHVNAFWGGKEGQRGERGTEAGSLENGFAKATESRGQTWQESQFPSKSQSHRA